MRVVERLTLEEIFMIALTIAFCFQRAAIGRWSMCSLFAARLEIGTGPGRQSLQDDTGGMSVPGSAPAALHGVLLNTDATSQRQVVCGRNAGVRLGMARKS